MELSPVGGSIGPPQAGHLSNFIVKSDMAPQFADYQDYTRAVGLIKHDIRTTDVKGRNKR